MGAPTPEPQRFGKYQILERIATGGVAEIYRARLDGIGGFSRTFAIKRILPHLTRNQEFVHMLVEEAKIAGLLSHANIVQILDLGSVGEHYFIAMEYVNGRDLSHILDRCAQKGITLPVPHAVYVIIEILKALDYAHNRQVMRGGRTVPLNIIHRDVSPGNVLISFQGEVKLTDFGIAKASTTAAETVTGVVKGRYDYASPEQARGEPIDQRADLFAVGVLLYELLTGHHPFRQPTEVATLEAIKKTRVTPPSEVNPDVPYSLDLVVQRCLAPDLAERYPVAASFKEALDRFFHDSGFIFSASTLAAFLRGLYPEADQRGRRFGSEDDTRQLEEIDLDDDSVSLPPVSSTAETQARPAPPPAAVPAAAPPPRSIPPAAVMSATIGRPVPPPGGGARKHETPAGFGEQSTLIRHDPVTRPGAEVPGEWGEAETVIRPENKLSEGAERPTVASAPVPGPTPGVEPPPAPAAAPPPRVDASRTRIVYRTATQVHLLYLAIAFATLIAGFAGGMVAGGAMANHAAEAQRSQPTVEVIVPTAALVTVDGVPLTGPSPRSTRLVANKRAVLHVEVPGAPAVETELTLDYNQTRILDYTSPPAPTAPK